MKKLIIVCTIIAGLVCGSTHKVSAQNQQGEFVASAGGGFSVLFAVLGSLGTVSSNITGGTLTNSTLPVISAAGDYALSSRFSLGLGIGYQSSSITDKSFNDSANGYYNQNATATISRLNVGIRTLFHFGTNPNVDCYIGFRVGASLWNVGLTSTDPNFNFAGKLSGTLPSFQALFGIKGYFTKVIGAHCEIAVGTPYLIEAGLSFRFGNTGA